MKMKFRRATAEDCEDILKLQKQWAAEDITYGFKAEALETLETKIRCLSYIAEAEDEIIGFLTASIREAKALAVMKAGEKYIEIEDIYVSGKYRDQGIGSKLIETVLEEASKQGIERAMVYSASKDMDNIIAFYRKHGFKSWYIEMFK